MAITVKALKFESIDTTVEAYRRGATDEALSILCELQDLQDYVKKHYDDLDIDETLDRLHRMEMRLRNRYQTFADHRITEQGYGA